MLSAAWANRLAVPSHADHAALVVVSDSQLEPALLVLRQFVHSALLPAATPAATATARPRASRAPHGSEQNVLLVCFEQAPERLLPPAGTFEPNRVEVVDASLAGPYLAPPGQAPRATSHSRVRTQQVDLSGSNGTRHLNDAVANAVGRLANAGTDGGAPRPVTIVIDSVNVLAEEVRGGNGEALRAVKRIYEGLRGCRKVHHDDYPPAPAPAPVASTSAHSLSTPALLPYLLGPSLSPSTLHLTLRPSAYLELLSREYGFSPDPDEVAADPRTGTFLESLARRRVGDAWRRPERAEEEDERVEMGAVARGAAALAALGAGAAAQGGDRGETRGRGGQNLRGGCVVEWSCRGLEERDAGSSSSRSGGGSAGRSTTGSGAAPGEVKRVVRSGFAGVRAARRSRQEGSERLEAWEVVEVSVADVLDPKRMGVRAASRAVPDQSTTNRAGASSPAAATGPPRPPSSSTTTTSQPPSSLPFSLGLTESQRLARSLVSNPYAGVDKPIYGQEGYQVPVVPGAGVAGGMGLGAVPGAAAVAGATAGGGGIEYTADRGDDLDEEDPDEDLEL
ncbi:hypothetical protein JCM8202v2_002156 [Rhodotorula sphaerocarpa]